MNQKFSSAAKVGGVYLLFSALWIFFSDKILVMITSDLDTFQMISTYKGWAFVLASAAIIYFLVHNEVAKLKIAQQNIEDLEKYDTLTGLCNREYFQKQLIKIYDKDMQVSVIMMDINGLRIINEMYGYQEGDKLLLQFSEYIKDKLPENSLLSRIGGDEFAAILYECSYEEATRISSVLLEGINEMEEKKILFSFSLGYSTTCDTMHNIYESVALSEDRLLKHKLLQSDSQNNSIITTLTSTLFEKSDETETHATRIADICEQVALKLGLPNFQVNELKLFAILHDIGKIGVGDEILKKPGRLDELEFNKMKLHSQIGYKMANSIPQLESIAYNILTHHERWDGNGYPKGLKGIEIPLNSRILAVADAYDAMINDRVYRKALGKDKAIEELLINKEKQFDPVIVDIFLDIYGNEKAQ